MSLTKSTDIRVTAVRAGYEHHDYRTPVKFGGRTVNKAAILNTLPQWIRFTRLTHLKIKLNGDDLQGDLERIVNVDRITTETQAELGVDTWLYSLDFNECCPNVEYLTEMQRKLREHTPRGFDRVQYIEQLMAAAAQKLGMFLCVQDLSCPGASLIHSAGIAAIESNSRQYVPAANQAWALRFPGIFTIRDGSMDTRCLTGVGLGAVPPSPSESATIQPLAA